MLPDFLEERRCYPELSPTGQEHSTGKPEAHTSHVEKSLAEAKFRPYVLS